MLCAPHAYPAKSKKLIGSSLLRHFISLNVNVNCIFLPLPIYKHTTLALNFPRNYRSCGAQHNRRTTASPRSIFFSLSRKALIKSNFINEREKSSSPTAAGGAPQKNARRRSCRRLWGTQTRERHQKGRVRRAGRSYVLFQECEWGNIRREREREKKPGGCQGDKLGRRPLCVW